MALTQADYLASLKTSRDNILTELAAVTADTQPYSVDGQSVQPRRTFLLEQLEKVNALIREADAGFQIFSVGDTG